MAPYTRSWLTALFVLGLAVRLVFNFVAHPPAEFIYSDMWVYDHRAENLRSGRLGPIDTFTPPGYPALLATVYTVAGEHRFAVVAVLHAAMGAMLPIFVYAIGRRFVRRRAALWTATALIAGYFPLIFYGGLLLTEVSFAFLMLLSLWLLVRAGESKRPQWVVGCGLTLGALSVVKPNGLLLLPLAAVYLWYAVRERGCARRLALVGVLLASAAPPCFAATLHNSRLLGRPAFLATNGGLNFFLAHAPYQGVRHRELDTGFVHKIVPIYNRMYYTKMYDSPRPLYDERHYYRESFALIRQDPLRLMRDLNNVIEGLGAGRQTFWPGWPRHDRTLELWSRGFFWLGILPALASAVFFSARRRWQRERWLVVGAVATAVFGLYAFLGDPRLRVPFDPLILLLAAEGVTEALRAVVAGVVLPSPASPILPPAHELAIDRYEK